MRSSIVIIRRTQPPCKVISHDGTYDLVMGQFHVVPLLMMVDSKLTTRPGLS